MFRLAHEPRRLFSRYLIEPWYILLLLLMDYPRSRAAAKVHGRGPVNYAGSDDQSSPIQMRGD
jgi:UDP-N-acetyl-D-mannosaminuronic acid transferase (WecB/TagA/CpsF family)